MSQENVEVVRRALQRFKESGGEIASECYDPDVVFTTRPDGPALNTYRGIDGLRRGLKSVKEAWSTLDPEPGEFVDGAEVVVVPVLWHLRSRAGVEMDVEETWAYWLRDGRIYRVEQHGSMREALRSAGLEE
jgi:ketosteroid isomerase-like protein